MDLIEIVNIHGQKMKIQEAMLYKYVRGGWKKCCTEAAPVDAPEAETKTEPLGDDY